MRGYYAFVGHDKVYDASACVEGGKRRNQAIALSLDERAQRASWAAHEDAAAAAAKAMATMRQEVAKGMDDLKESRYFEAIGQQMVAGARDEMGNAKSQKVLSDSVETAMDKACKKNTLLRLTMA